ncbi:phosphotransferase, partial [Achromobacter xylosoxidans]|nr:phosphotransferase [Achromobacter xylosoxidans]
MKAQARYTLPGPIADFIGDAPLIADQVGESPSRVYHFIRGNDVFFLKASAAVYAPTTYSVRREAQVLQWLAGHLNVPEVVRVADNADGEFMLTRRVPGVPLQARMD